MVTEPTTNILGESARVPTQLPSLPAQHVIKILLLTAIISVRDANFTN